MRRRLNTPALRRHRPRTTRWSADEVRQADLFFADLMGHPPAVARRAFSPEDEGSESLQESSETYAPLETFESSEADQRPEAYEPSDAYEAYEAPDTYEASEASEVEDAHEDAPETSPAEGSEAVETFAAENVGEGEAEWAEAWESTALQDDAPEDDAAEQGAGPVDAFLPPIDAAVVWNNGKAYFFKGDKYVRYTMGSPEGADSGYPKKIKGPWTADPPSPSLWYLDIDAAIVWNKDTAYFFKGDEFIKYALGPSEGAEKGYPQKIKGNWPGLWERDIDAVMMGTDGFAYFFKGDEYRRFPVADDPRKQTAEASKKIRDKWPGVWDRDVDAAIAWPNGKAYFFKGNEYISAPAGGGTASAKRRIAGNWPGLIGAPSTLRRMRFPPRPSTAVTGTAFFDDLDKKIDPHKAPSPADWKKREDAMVAALTSGNMPDFLLQWIEVDVSRTLDGGPGKGRSVKGVIRVLPEYLAVGSDTDHVHVPLDQISAQRVSSVFGTVLPTARICQRIYEKAPTKLAGPPRDYWQTDPAKRKAPANWAQDSTAAYREHSKAIRKKLETDSVTPGTLVAGHKKDVVLSRDLRIKSYCVSFHGFYDKAGFPAEPCYEKFKTHADPACVKDTPTLAHDMHAKGHMFSDYSQGVRLVHPFMTVDGVTMSVASVLADPTLSYLISSEGPIRARIPRPSREIGAGGGDGY